MSNIDFEFNIRESIWVFRRYISKIVPFFAFVLGLNIVIQILGLVGLGTAFSYLHLTEGLGTFVDLLVDGEFMLFFETILDQTVFLVLIGLTMVVGAIANLAGYSLILGGFIELVKNSLIGERVSVGVGLNGAVKYFKRLFLLYLLALILLFLGFVLPFVVGQLSIVAGVLTGLFSVIALLFIYVVFFLFAQEAIVIEDVGVLSGLRKSGGFVKSNLLEVVGYIILVVAVSIVIGVLSQLFTFLFRIPVESFVSVFMLLVVLPVLLILKVRMYTAYKGVGEFKRFDAEYWPWMKNGFLKSWNTFLGFVKKELGLFGVSLGIFLIGVLGGWYLGGYIPFELAELDLPQQIDLGVDGAFASLFLYLMFHNWTVGIGVAFGGIVFGLPTIGALLLNGGIVGVVFALIDDLVFFLVGILPHGVIEIPAIAFAAAMGLKLGIGLKKYLWNDLELEQLGDKIEKVMIALVGLFPLFAVAGIIEAFITPVLMSIFLGTPLF
ncbi:stage II sporulation protein M [Methanonatronarchaeum sp. AMET-Sl]|uniref:stage II sporulation protein M n=1 Tax=Methanonatronarchaeum sp. AMET-Sl TaxID=3037654 RepID=UPI00244DA3DD|nr:stage II sporulation protein M [Methanonatronarchaeum sp. AMET-Sl]WGI17536.1 stage II sporulation protein M [Methanonatronarchaeum sp. AMET-Sl]